MKRFLLSLFTAILFAITLGSCFGAPVGIGAFIASATIKAPVNSFRMAVTPEIWTDYIVGNLFKDNEFILESVDESNYVVGGTLVHIPQAGTVSKAERNRSTLPATITRRRDTDVTYALDELTTDPRYIPEADKVELSYNKVDSCMTEDMAAIKQLSAESMLFNWRPTFYIKSTGDAAAANTVYGTGNRKGVKVADFATAKTIFNKWGIAKNDRFVILWTEQLDQLAAELRASSNSNATLNAVYNPVTGTLEKLEGFKIFERSSVLLASNSTLTAVKNMFKWTSDDLLYTPEEFVEIETEEKSAATTSCAVGLFWSKSAVARAMGDTKMFENIGDPTYFGDIYSFLQRLGGRARRGDGKGVLGLISAA
jgi:hypothetical protein